MFIVKCEACTVFGSNAESWLTKFIWMLNMVSVQHLAQMSRTNVDFLANTTQIECCMSNVHGLPYLGKNRMFYIVCNASTTFVHWRWMLTEELTWRKPMVACRILCQYMSNICYQCRMFTTERPWKNIRASDGTHYVANFNLGKKLNIKYTVHKRLIQ